MANQHCKNPIPVNWINLRQISWLRVRTQTLNSEWREYANGYFSQTTEPGYFDQEDGYGYQSWMDEDVNFSRTYPDDSLVAVALDMNVPDAMLQEQFLSFLKEYRGKQKIAKSKKNIQRISFATWIDYGVLPYIDLTTWSLHLGRPISEDVLASAVFNNNRFDKDKLKTTKNHVNRILGDEWQMGYSIFRMLGAMNE
jgi:hypothetical protein